MERMTATLDSTGTTAAVIVTHQRAELLRASLEKVVNQTHPVQWVIVVDNGAENAVRELVDSMAGDSRADQPARRRSSRAAESTTISRVDGFARLRARIPRMVGVLSSMVSGAREHAKTASTLPRAVSRIAAWVSRERAREI